MAKRFGKNDGILLILLAVILVSGCILFYRFGGRNGAVAVVTVAGKPYGTYSLDKDALIEIKVDGKVTNILEIREGKADMMQADCPDKLCVHQKAISKTNETIVCLPNKVVVEIINSQVAEFDSMT